MPWPESSFKFEIESNPLARCWVAECLQDADSPLLVAMIVIELLFVGLFVAVLVGTWPTPPWTLLQWGGPALMLLGPLALFPFTKTLYLAFDLTFRREL